MQYYVDFYVIACQILTWIRRFSPTVEVLVCFCHLTENVNTLASWKKAGSTLTRSRNRSPWRTETSDTTACSYCLPWTTFIVVDLGKKRQQYQSFGLLSRTTEAKIPLKCWTEHPPSWYSADPEVSLPAFCGNRSPCGDAFSWLHGLSLPTPPGHPCWGLI